MDLELATPSRTVMRWNRRPVPVPDGVGGLDIFRDATADGQAAEQHERLAMTDATPQLPNGTLGLQLIARELSRARRELDPLGVARRTSTT